MAARVTGHYCYQTGGRTRYPSPGERAPPLWQGGGGGVTPQPDDTCALSSHLAGALTRGRRSKA